MSSRTVKETSDNIEPLQVKIALLIRGKSLHRWSLENGFEQSTVWRCLHEGYRGRKTAAIARRLKEDLLDNP